MCAQTCHSLFWLKVRVGAVASPGERVGETSAFGRCHQAPVHWEQPDAPTGVPASPPRHTRAYTHTPSVLESHWQPLHKHKEAKLCHCQDQSLGGRVCVFAWLWTVKKSYIKPDWKCLIDFWRSPRALRSQHWKSDLGSPTWTGRVTFTWQSLARLDGSLSSVFLALPRVKELRLLWTDTRLVSMCHFSSSCSYFFFILMQT